LRLRRRILRVAGCPGAPDDFEQGYFTQTWLAVSEDAAGTVSSRYWHHRQPRTPAKDARDPGFQDRLLARLAELTRVSLFGEFQVPQGPNVNA
jgi:hypothetical protein